MGSLSFSLGHEEEQEEQEEQGRSADDDDEEEGREVNLEDWEEDLFRSCWRRYWFSSMSALFSSRSTSMATVTLEALYAMKQERHCVYAKRANRRERDGRRRGGRDDVGTEIERREVSVRRNYKYVLTAWNYESP